MKALVIAALLLVLAPGAAGAQPAGQPQPDAEARAKELFEAGHAAADRDDHAEACAKFEASLALFRRASTLLNLGACHEKLGHTATALRYWQLGAAALEADDERLLLAKGRITRLDELAPRFHVTLPEALPAAASIRLDGGPVTREGLAGELRLDPGEHQLELAAPGHEVTSISVELTDGDDKTVALELGREMAPLEATPPPEPPPQPLPASQPPLLPAPDDDRTIPVWVWPTGGLGLVAAGVGVAFAIDYASTLADQASRCAGALEACRPDPPGSYDPADDNARKERDAILGVVIGASGAAAVLAAVIGAIIGEPSRASTISVDARGVSLSF